MPSVSVPQQRLFGMALAAKKGQLPKPSPLVKRLATSMKRKQLTDFARTPSLGLHSKSIRYHNKST
jgi:hypothetical protein